MTGGPPAPGEPRPPDPTAGDPGAVTAPYTPPTASTTTGGSSDAASAPLQPPTPTPPPVPTSPPPPTGLPPGVGWAPPVPARQEVAPGLVFSDTLARVVAYVIDGLLIALVAGILAEPLGWNALPVGYDPFSDESFRTTEYAILTAVLGALYFIASWSGGRRATLGQRLLKIQVANAFDGRPLSLDQAARRWLGLGEFLPLLGITPGLGVLASGLQLIWVIVLLITTATSPTKQGLHDRIANSAVVRPVNAGNGVVVACLIIVLVLAAITLLSIVALTFLGSQVGSILSEVGESV